MKTAALLVMSVLSLPLLSGCGNSQPEAASPASTPSPATGGPPVTSTSAPTTPPPAPAPAPTADTATNDACKQRMTVFCDLFEAVLHSNSMIDTSKIEQDLKAKMPNVNDAMMCPVTKQKYLVGLDVLSKFNSGKVYAMDATAHPDGTTHVVVPQNPADDPAKYEMVVMTLDEAKKNPQLQIEMPSAPKK